MKEQPILGTVSKDDVQKEEVKHKRLSEVGYNCLSCVYFFVIYF